MAALDEIVKQGVVLRSYSALGSRDDRARLRAIDSFVQCGSSGRWMLQIAVRQTSQARVQFAAAVALHRLGDAQGLMVLTESLKWRLPTEPSLAAELESAFIAIGSPDAAVSLVTVWNMLPDWGDNGRVRQSICSIWAALKNPVALPALASGALLCQEAFERTVPAFGEMAIPMLRDLGRSADPARRALAIRTLRHMRSESAYACLVPMLRDGSFLIRRLVPDALILTGAETQAVIDISVAVCGGFASPESLAVLARVRPPDLADTLTSMLEAWRPTSEDPGTLTVAVALATLTSLPLDEQRVRAALCRVLKGPAESGLSVTLIQSIETMSRRAGPPDDALRSVLMDQLCRPADRVREQAAVTLARLGDMFPARAVAYIEESKPQDSFLTQLQVIFRGGKDAGQAASQAVHQVSKWWARLTSEDAGLWRMPGAANPFDAATAAQDSRLVPMLRQMLKSAISTNCAHVSPEESPHLARFAILVLRALGRVGPPSAIDGTREILAALHLPHHALPDRTDPPPSALSNDVRMAAAETLITLHGCASFGLLLEALYSPQAETVRTGIVALGLLGETRALPHLRAIAEDPAHVCAEEAQRAVAQIKRTNPEMMSLLRGASAATSEPGTLLRASLGNQGDTPPDLLLRPTNERCG